MYSTQLLSILILTELSTVKGSSTFLLKAQILKDLSLNSIARPPWLERRGRQGSFTQFLMHDSLLVFCVIIEGGHWGAVGVMEINGLVTFGICTERKINYDG